MGDAQSIGRAAARSGQRSCLEPMDDQRRGLRRVGHSETLPETLSMLRADKRTAAWSETREPLRAAASRGIAYTQNRWTRSGEVWGNVHDQSRLPA